MNDALKVGAMQYSTMHSSSSDWRSIDSAPRDGTVVEIKNTYGVAPWYGLYKWTGKRTSRDQHGNVHEYNSEPAWVSATDGSISISGEGHIKWRPYAGEVQTYSDPTGGMQNDMAYWRGAVAAKHGFPVDYFEGFPRAAKWWQFWK